MLKTKMAILFCTLPTETNMVPSWLFYKIREKSWVSIVN